MGKNLKSATDQSQDYLTKYLPEKAQKVSREKKKVSRGCRAPPTVTTCNFRVLSFQYSLLSSGSQSFHSQQTFASQFSGYYLAHQSLELYSFNDRGKKLS